MHKAMGLILKSTKWKKDYTFLFCKLRANLNKDYFTFVSTSKLTNSRIQVFELMLPFPVLSSSLPIRILQPFGKVKEEKRKRLRELTKLVSVQSLWLRLQLTLKWTPFLANHQIPLELLLPSSLKPQRDGLPFVYCHVTRVVALKWQTLYSTPNPSFFPFLVNISYSQINFLLSLLEKFQSTHI